MVQKENISFRALDNQRRSGGERGGTRGTTGAAMGTCSDH